MQIVELSVDSPMAPQPEGCGVTLFRHQRTLLHRLQLLERGSIDLSDPCIAHPEVAMDIRMIFDPQLRDAETAGDAEDGASSSVGSDCPVADVKDTTTTKFSTRIGIIGDKVGAGKSHVILSLAYADFRARRQENQAAVAAADACDTEVVTHTFAHHRIAISSSRVHTNTLPMTIVVVPHTLCTQWNEYVSRFGGGMRTVSISRRRHLQDNASSLDKADLVLVTSTFYNALAIQLMHRRVRRVVFDEADSLNISGCMTINASFHWFATASFRNLQFPAGSGWWGNSRLQTGVRSTGFIRHVFADMYATQLGRHSIKLLIARNSESFVSSSMELPEPLVHIVKCRTPYAIRVLRGVVDRAVIQRLNAGDVTAALQHISPQNRGSEDNIITVLLNKLSRQEHNLTQRITLLSDLQYDTEDEREAERARLTSQLDDTRDRMNNIRSRVSDSSTCGICYEEVVVSSGSTLSKTVVPCCSNAFCFMCINRWLDQQQKCPMCKASLGVGNLLVVDASSSASPSVAAEQEAAAVPSAVAGVSTRESNNKLDNLEAILRGRLGGSERTNKVMLFVAFDNDFTVERWLAPLLDSMRIKWRFFKGNHHTTAAIERDYRHGDLDVLLVNTNNYGSGLNCENTTDVIMMNKFDSDIEQQVIGRAQRPGRTCPLNVWYLVFENEISGALQ